MTTHECGCAFFGPGPHPVDARHRNARGCEHAEDGLDVERLVQAERIATTRDEPKWRTARDRLSSIAREYAALGAAQEKGEAGS